MTEDIRISLNLTTERESVWRLTASSGTSTRERAEIAASVHRLLAPLWPELRESGGLDGELDTLPLFSAVIRGADPAPATVVGMELLNALTSFGAPLELDVTFVPRP